MTMPQCRLRKFAHAILIVAAWSLLQGTGWAQAPDKNREADVTFTYAAMRAAERNTTSFWLQGGAVELHARFYRGLGMAASVTGMHEGSNSRLIAPLDLVTVVFGPRYTLDLHRRASMFTEGLVGEAHGFHSVFALGSGSVSNSANGTTDNSTSFALQAGGGFDLRLTRHLSTRVVQADYLRTQLPNGAGNLQNNFRVSAGFIFRFAQ
jgi:hypothetical protein